MELSEEQQVELLRSAGIDDVEEFLEGKELVYFDVSTLIYKGGNGGTFIVSFKKVYVYGEGYTYIKGYGHTFVYSEGYTFVKGDGNTHVTGNGEIIITKRGKE